MGRTTAPGSSKFLLFVYGSLLPGEPDADLLRDAKALGSARTSANYRLVDLGRYPALIENGHLAIEGEVFEVGVDQLRLIDGRKELGRLFQRRAIRLEDGRSAEVYLMGEDQVRGRRRLRGGDWRRRFELVSSRIPRR